MEKFESKPPLLGVPDYSELSEEPPLRTLKDLKEKFS